MTTLHKAALEGDADKVKGFISDGKSVNEKDEDERTALHWATSGGHDSIVNFLLNQDADILQSDEEGWIPFHIACSAGHYSIVKQLLQRAKEKNVLQEMIDSKTRQQRTGLHYAASKGYGEIVQRIIDEGAQVNARDKYGESPMFRAIARDQRGIAQMLRNAKAKVNLKNSEGNTVLHVAVLEKNLAAIDWLLNTGADPDIENHDQQTPEEICPDDDFRRSYRAKLKQIRS
eukprot:gb/GECH01013312.1/.p1 GENE.gb/GECH01013312.1/~~gb/GECH01013312.1/.p1  ORF type:complete len:231 (+),score=77.21 gb/GECH01013312.1/:1-693(+)